MISAGPARRPRSGQRTAVNPQRLGLRGAGAGSRRADACRPARRPASCGPGSSRRRHVPAPRELREEDDGLDGARTPRLRKTWPCEQRPRLTARNPPAVGADLHPQNPSGKPAAASYRDLAASASRPSGTSSRGVRREPPSWERGKRGLLRTRSIPLASPGTALGTPSPRPPLPPTQGAALSLHRHRRRPKRQGPSARLRSCPRKLFFTRPVRLTREIQSAARPLDEKRR